MSLGTKIKQLREEKHWTQGQLATYSGVTRSYISVLEGTRPSKRPGSNVIVKLAKALEIDEDVLLQAAGIKRATKPTLGLTEDKYLKLPNNLSETDVKMLEAIANHLAGKAATYEADLEARRQIPMEESIRDGLARQEQLTNLINGGKVIKEGDKETEKAS